MALTTSAIWKFTITPLDGFVEMPDKARVLTAQMQHGVITLWAIVDPDAKRITRQFAVVATGMPFPTEWAYEGMVSHYIATVQDGEFVWHIFG